MALCKATQKTLCDASGCDKCFQKSFASHPKASCWSDKNEKKPRDVLKSSGTKYTFNCDICNHVFHSGLNNISVGKWCPYCANKYLCDNTECQECFQKSYASHPKASCWSDKNEKKPRYVFKSSNKKYIINCDICNHEFQSTLSHISAGTWCPYCVNKQLCDNINCNDCFQKSFASHARACYWSDKNEKKPRDIFKISANKYIFNCDTCNHEFHSNLSHISAGTWCPYCANQTLCDNTECQECFQKSFASHPKACCWSNKNEKTPRYVFKSTTTKYTLNCDTCNHQFHSTLGNISSGHWCPYCANQTLCDNTECQECFQKSFASHEKASRWSNKNEKKPRDVFKSSGTKYTFNCDTCNHEFHSVLASISLGTWCPYCVNKTELKLYQWLTEVVPDMEREKTFEWCVNENTGKCFRYDFHSQTMKLLIELDGPQHFTQVSNWGCPIQSQQRDILKMKKANENGYSVLRLLQEDVLYDVYDWKNELLQVFKNHQKENITNIYLCKNEEYECYNHGITLYSHDGLTSASLLATNL
jgi:Probable Zinc-ribbon domain/Protein of unknown function (DUF559)